MGETRDFEADRELCDAASPGPWAADEMKVTDGDPRHYCMVVLGQNHRTPAHCYGTGPHRRADCRFIAAAREGWPAALREIDLLRAMYAAACERIASQSDALSRTAEGKAVLLLEKLRRIDHAIRTGSVLSFAYVNHRKESARRQAWPRAVLNGATEFHPEPQWLMSAWCNDRKQQRDFSVEAITFD